MVALRIRRNREQGQLGCLVYQQHTYEYVFDNLQRLE